jgi:hypothetical protein
MNKDETMSQADEARRAIQEAGLNLDQDTLDRLARGEEVELSAESAPANAAADVADCCGAGWIGIGHNPRWCIKPGFPPKIKICWG